MSTDETDGPDYLAQTRAIYAALNGRDFGAVTSMFGPAAIWDVSRWGLGSKSGRDAIRQFLEDWFGSLAEYEVQLEEIHDLGGGVVFAVVLQVGRRAGSRGLLQMRSAPVFVWEDEGIARLTLYRDIQEARAAALLLAKV
jgi:ketosteroid isomerase-like protein